MLTWVAALVVALTFSAGSAQGFLTAINGTRSAAGLGTVSMDTGLSAHARTHTAYMIAGSCPDDRPICHSSDSALRSAAGSGWSKLGENVGKGATVASLHQAFLDSPSHRANMLGDYTHVGIGTDTHDGALYVTAVFVKRDSTTTTTAAPETTTTTQPPATTTTTQPSTTTTGQPSTIARPSTPATAQPSTIARPSTPATAQPSTISSGSIVAAVIRSSACLVGGRP